MLSKCMSVERENPGACDTANIELGGTVSQQSSNDFCYFPTVPSIITQPPLPLGFCCIPLSVFLSFWAAGFDSAMKHPSCLVQAPRLPQGASHTWCGAANAGTAKASLAQLNIKVMSQIDKFLRGRRTKMYRRKINDKREKKKSVKSKCRIKSQKFFFQQQILKISFPLKKIT